MLVVVLVVGGGEAIVGNKTGKFSFSQRDDIVSERVLSSTDHHIGLVGWWRRKSSTIYRGYGHLER